MNLMEKYGSKALIAGASEGIGAAYAEYLAKEGLSLCLVARREVPLKKFAVSLSEKYVVKVKYLVCDLSDEKAAGEVISFTSDEEPDIMIYNAALSHIGSFEKQPVEDHCQAAQVNMLTPLRLVHHFGNMMLEKERGAIVLMSSLAGLQGSGYLAGYAAGKAFNRILAESLWYEWKERGVDIMACCAGATSTPGYINSAPAKANLFAPAVQDPGKLVRECFSKLGNKPSFITGRGNRIASFFMHRILPRKMAVMIMGSNTRKMYGVEL